MSATSAFPKISIVTPSFNQAAFIEEALLSVKNQNYPNVEHIVVDGASTDGTVGILHRYSSQPGWEHLRWVSEPDKGQSDALNKGLQVVTGDIVGWLNSDDRYRANCFRNVIQGFVSYPQADMLYGDYTMIDQVGRIFRIRREIEFNRFILSYLHILYVPTPSSFFRSRIFREGNWIDTSLDYAMDYEFILRLAEKGYEFQHIHELLADFRLHPASKSGVHSSKQRAEQDEIALAHSVLLASLKGGRSKRTALAVLRAVARGIRYCEKLRRGYYFEQFRPSLPGPFGWKES